MAMMWQETRTTVRSWSRAMRRMTRVPAIVRLVILAAGVGSLLLVDRKVLLLLLLPLAVAVFPRTMLATLYTVIVAALWIITTAIAGGPIPLWRLCALALTLYVVHVSAALAAVLPYDAAVPMAVLRPWLIRLVIVSVLTVGLGWVVQTVPRLLKSAPELLGATIAGIVLMVTATIFIGYLGKRPQ